MLTHGVKVSITNQVTDHFVTARQSIENDQARLEVTLDPPELGRIKIELLGKNDQLSARLIVSDGLTLDAIRDSLPRMFDALADSGISFDNFQLESSTSQSRERRDDIENLTGYVDTTEVEEQLNSLPSVVLRANSINILV